MLKIRQEQLGLLRAAMLQRFEYRIESQLRRQFPKHPLLGSRETLSDFIRHGMDRADRYGITDEADVERFLIWMIPYGPDFRYHTDLSWLLPFLSNRQLSGTEKVNELENSELFSRKK